MTNTFAQPEFVERPERYIAALSKQFNLETRGEIPALWGQLWTHDFKLPGLNREEAFGVSYAGTLNGDFSYGAGYEITDPTLQPEGGCVITLSAGRYARFAQRTKFAEIPQMFDWVFTTWLPGSDQSQREGAVFEVYPADPDATDEARLFEIWLPIKS